MRTLWIGLLTLLARGLQAWSEAVARRLASMRRSPLSGANASHVREAAELTTPDYPSDEVDGPPADWIARVKSAQPPTHWRAKVQQGGSDSIERAAPSTPADSPIEPQQSEDSVVASPATRPAAQPRLSAQPFSQPKSKDSDAVRTEERAVPEPPAHDRVVTPARSAAIRSQIDPVSSTAAVQRTNPVTAPDEETSTSSDEVITARSQPAAPSSEHRHLTSTHVTDDAHAPSATTEQGVDDREQTDRFAYAERNVPDLDQSQHAPQTPLSETLPDQQVSPVSPDKPRHASLREPVAAIDLTYPIESRADQVAVTPSPTPSPHRSEFAVNDRVAGNTLRSSHTWATISEVGSAEYESSAIENQWPALPPERVTVNEDFETVLRERERLRRLDLEQRGLGWSA